MNGNRWHTVKATLVFHVMFSKQIRQTNRTVSLSISVQLSTPVAHWLQYKRRNFFFSFSFFVWENLKLLLFLIPICYKKFALQTFNAHHSIQKGLLTQKVTSMLWYEVKFPDNWLLFGKCVELKSHCSVWCSWLFNCFQHSKISYWKCFACSTNYKVSQQIRSFIKKS